MGISLGNLGFTPSIAGVWTTVDQAYLVNGIQGNIATHYGNVNLGMDQLNGVIITGWSVEGYENQGTV